MRKFDIFFSFSQTEVDGFVPSEREMLLNLFDQIKLADDLGFETAWIADAHLSIQVQKQSPQAVLTHFNQEIGLNTDILQLAHKLLPKTKKINFGSAIRNIICNGGPIAHAEAIKTFLYLNSLDNDGRILNIGFAAGRFDFVNAVYGIYPRNKLEKIAWRVIKRKIFQEATEIFLRALKGDTFNSSDIKPKFIRESDFQTREQWQAILQEYGTKVEEIEIPSSWNFNNLKLVPAEVFLQQLQLTIGSHDPEVQILANQFLPCRVFNLSITPSSIIEATHERMKKHYHSDGGKWHRCYLPRTTLVFINGDKSLSEKRQSQTARLQGARALENYWKGMEGTLHSERIKNSQNNALIGNPPEIISQIEERFHPEDKLMLWFDFNNHNNEEVKKSMKCFMEKVAPFV